MYGLDTRGANEFLETNNERQEISEMAAGIEDGANDRACLRQITVN